MLWVWRIRVRHLFMLCLSGCKLGHIFTCWLQCSSGCKLRLPARCLLRLPARNCFVLGLLWLPARTCCGQANAGRAATPHAGDAPRVQLRELRRGAREGVGGAHRAGGHAGQPRQGQQHAAAPCCWRGGVGAGAGGASAVVAASVLSSHNGQ